MICAVVLAAGRSVRMGQQKLLLPIRGKPMIAGIVHEVVSSSVDTTVIVLGADAEAVRGAVAAHRNDVSPSPHLEEKARASSSSSLAFVTNSDPHSDMLSSVRCGLRALPDSCETVLVVLGDQPGVTTDLIERLILAYCSSTHRIIVPVNSGRRGHPVLFSCRLRDEVLTQYDGQGLRALLQAHPEQVLEVNIPARNDLEDLDTPEEYRRFSEQCGS
jgi:molybdenum cofactor cytidylyltransferase